MADPTLNVEIIGNKIVTDLYSTEDIVVVGKTEVELNLLTLSDSWQSIPVSKIGTISKIIADVESSDDTVDATANLRITYTSGAVIVMPFNGVFVYSVDETFSSSITDIDISTSSTTGMDCKISILGI